MIKDKTRRPTEERALGSIAREANRLGVSQSELLARSFVNGSKPAVCHCIYCRRKREKNGKYRVVFNQ